MVREKKKAKIMPAAMNGYGCFDQFKIKCHFDSIAVFILEFAAIVDLNNQTHSLRLRCTAIEDGISEHFLQVLTRSMHCYL